MKGFEFDKIQNPDPLSDVKQIRVVTGFKLKEGLYDYDEKTAKTEDT